MPSRRVEPLLLSLYYLPPYEGRSDHQIHEGFQSLPVTFILVNKILSFNRKKNSLPTDLCLGGSRTPALIQTILLSTIMKEE
jgi:hypothetical protein